MRFVNIKHNIFCSYCVPILYIVVIRYTHVNFWGFRMIGKVTMIIGLPNKFMSAMDKLKALMMVYATAPIGREFLELADRARKNKDLTAIDTQVWLAKIGMLDYISPYIPQLFAAWAMATSED